MAFTLEHVLVSQQLDLVMHDTAQGFFFTVAAQGKFLVLHPGRLQRDATASVRHSMRIDTPSTQPPAPPHGIDDPTGGGFGSPHGHDPVPHPLHNGVQVTVEAIPLELRIMDPNGQLFTRNEITLADLKKFRTVRGASRPWSFTLIGTSRTYQPLAALNESVTEPKGALNLGLTETVVSASAPPLVSPKDVESGIMRLTFDLYRVGNFVATVVRRDFLSLAWRGSMRLLDPNGAEFALSNNDRLRCAIPLSVLGRSRDAAGKSRLWTLEVRSLVPGGQHRVTASVVGSASISTEVLKARIQRIFGPDGTFLSFKGVNVGDRAKALLTISDVASAETIDMFDLLDSRLKATGSSTDVNANTAMVLFDRESDIGYGAKVDVSSLKTTFIKVSVGQALHLAPNTPAVRIAVGVQGRVKVVGHGLTLATAKVNSDKVELEVGLQIDPDGTPRVVSWVPDKPFDIDFSAASIAAWIAIVTAAGAGAGGLGGPIGAIGGAIVGLIGGSVSAVAVEKAVQSYINGGFSDGVKKLFDDPTLAPRIFMTLLGAHVNHLPTKFVGTDVVFEYVAPLEPDPKPRRNYVGAIGRTLLEEAVGHTGFLPRTLGDTWAAANLKQKIDHIVVVMMENRSYDHVLGYRSLRPTDPNLKEEGWTPELIQKVNERAELWRPPPPPANHPVPFFDTNPPVQPMRLSAFPLNPKNLRTRLPKGVGHELDDVSEQMKDQIDGPDGKRINDPGGFINNFRHRKLENDPYGKDFVVPFDVLRYYEKDATVIDPNTQKRVDDLPMYSFLAENYAYCDHYYCSHPGPTLPNRMFSLAGDVQYDRYGFPILDNNDGDNFLLSRALTINDVLTREGVSWRVYESEPSVTMLRMFARYAGDNVNIRPLRELEHDVVVGNVPSVVVIEPAMHHHPEDDDHPDADMYRGQSFIKRVYAALTANPDVWAKTMLIITYDEHGGLYDHVIPPIADVFQSPFPDMLDPGHVAGTLTVDGTTTPPSSPPPTHVGPGGILHGGSHLHPELLDLLAGDLPELVSTEKTVKVPYGVRVPTFVVSSWTSAGKGPETILDHCSILKTILARFCGDKKPFLSDRVNASHSFEGYVAEPTPRTVGAVPDLGSDLPIDVRRLVSGTSQIITAPLSKKQMREELVDYHEISGRMARILGR